MLLIHGTGVESVLPEMSATAVETVDVLSVKEVRPPDGQGKGILARGGGNEMDVVSHQAIAFDLQAELSGLHRQQTKIDPPIIVHKEYVLAVVPPLRDMMRTARNDDPGASGHDGIMAQGCVQLNKNGSCPYFIPYFIPRHFLAGGWAFVSGSVAGLISARVLRTGSLLPGRYRAAETVRGWLTVMGVPI